MNNLFAIIMMNLTAELYQNGEKDINSMLLEEKQNRDLLLQSIASIILFKPVKDEVMNLSNKDYFESKKALDKLIKDNFTTEAKSEIKSLEDIIQKTATDKWGINNYVNSLGKEIDNKPIDKKVVDKIKNDKVAGKTAENRIWDNKNEVYSHTQKRVDDFLKGKISVNDIEKEIKTLYNSNAYNTKRLVQDQIARTQAKANEEWFKENGVEWVLYDATLDGKTCSDCGGLDGKTYRRDKDRPSIPKHVGCRCCYIGLPDKDWRPDKRLDRITSENIDYKTYEEWLTNKYGMLRRERNIDKFSHLAVPMQLKEVKKIASRAGVDLKGIKLKIQRDENLIGSKFMASAAPDQIGRIDLFPDTFVNEDELLQTLVHEKVHVEQYKKYGPLHVMNNLGEFEKEAYAKQEEWYNEYKRKKGRS